MDAKYIHSWTMAAACAVLTAGCNPDWSDRVPEVNAQTTQSNASDAQAAASSDGIAAAVPDGIATRPAESADDAALSSKVESALKSEPDLHGVAIAVRSQDGIVTLSGTAKDAQLRSMAAEVALSIDGVRHVKNEIALAQEA